MTWRVAARASTTALGLALLVATVLRLAWAPSQDLLRTARDRPHSLVAWELDRLVTDGAAVAALVATAGLALVFLLGICAALTAQARPGVAAVCLRLTPSLCRRWVGAACGLSLVAPLVAATSVSALTAEGHRQAPPCRVSCHRGEPASLGGLALPDLPTGRWIRPTDAPATGRTTVVVRRGDSLWRIAEVRLGPRATTADIAAATHRLYAVNHDAIGTDPDLILPGMTLIAPEGRL